MSEPNGCVRAFAIDLVSGEPDASETTDPRLREGSVETVAHARRPFRGVAAEVGEHLDGHRAELTGYCSRMLGSHVDAEDAVQETLIRAWRGLDRFEGRAALRTWLYGIATNVCFDHVRGSRRRAHPIDLGPGGSADALLARERLAPTTGVPAFEATDPADVAVSREESRLALVVALQRLPPRQRAALFLRDVLRWRAKEVADLLGATVPSVNSALQRARATLAARKVADADPTALRDEADRALIARFADAFARDDFDAIVAGLCEDVTRSRRPLQSRNRGQLGPGDGWSPRIRPVGPASGEIGAPR
jgi:RNA polymerase sigma-70 factor, ECF subfamily